jgi:DNA polymerase
MDRYEAVLRELNIYPLWVRREVVAEVVEQVNAVRLDPSIGSGLKAGVEGVVAENVVRQADNTTDITTSHLTRPAKDAGQVIGYSHSAKLSNNDSQVAGYHHERSKEQLEQVSEVAVVSEPVKSQPNNFNWPELKNTVHSCQACALRAGCTQTVFGVGDEKADWLFVGEGPGADEDALGEPFVGQAGKLLDNMLMAMKLKRGKNVYIANIVKCRPPVDESGKQLPPKHDEIAQCLPYLRRQIELIQPKVIVALGKIASNALLGKEATLASLRGMAHDFHGTPLIATYHPAYLLRSPSEKAKAWQDLCLAVERLRKQN